MGGFKAGNLAIFVGQAKKPEIVNGRLYGYKGIVVRAKRLCNNGVRQVAFHKKLYGFVKDSELQIIDRTQVERYLEKADKR